MAFIFMDGKMILLGSGSDSNSDEDYDLPPLVEKESPDQQLSNNNVNTTTSSQIMVEKLDNVPLYETSDLECVTNYKCITYPPLLHAETGEIVEEGKTSDGGEDEKEPAVYKKLIAQGEIIEIPEHLLKDIPYIETLFSGRFTVAVEDEGAVKTDEIDPKLLKVILKYLESGKLYKLVGSLPKECCVFDLFELLSFLAIKSPISTTLADVDKILKKTPFEICNQKELVEFILAIFHGYRLLDYRKTHNKTRNNIYDVVKTITSSDNKSFKPRAKFHLLSIAKKCVLFTYNQFQKIKNLKVKEDGLETSDTESVGEIYCSDYDDWFDDSYEYDFYDSDYSLPWRFDVDDYDCFGGGFYDSDSDDDYLYC